MKVYVCRIKLYALNFRKKGQKIINTTINPGDITELQKIKE